MSSNMEARHIERITSINSDGILSQIPEKPDDMIRRSWLRCINDYGLDPSQPPEAPVITSEHLRERQQRNEEFLRVARSGMEQLYKQVVPLGYSLMLSDSEGITLDRIANPTMEKDLRAAGVYIGANWNEIHAGTSGIGVVLKERTSLVCHQGDHFDKQYVSLSCVASPIFDPHGDLLAVLNIAASMPPVAKESQYLALQLTNLQAKAIEDANFIRHFEGNLILKLGRIWRLHEVNAAALLALDDDGLIIGANTVARWELTKPNQPEGWIIGCHISDVFDCSMDIIWKAAVGATAAPTLRMAGSLESHFLTVRIPRRHEQLQVVLPKTSISGLIDSAKPDDLYHLAGDDAGMRRMLNQARRLIDGKVNILIKGETGTGKEVLANALHKASNRAKSSFIAVNCAAIPETLIESELFGYMPGAFTGGRKTGMKGLIAQSDNGTLFLDEIGDMPLHLQSRLLRVLSEGEVTPIGSDKSIKVNLTVISATHRDLRTMISSSHFREDLYYRLCGAELRLPPLRERKDTEFIIHKLVQQESARLGFEITTTNDAMTILLAYSWPGNIRELRNAIRYAAVSSEDGVIRKEQLPEELLKSTTQPLEDRIKSDAKQTQAYNPISEKSRILLDMLWRHQWNITAVAEELGVFRTTIYRQMKRFKITPPTKTSPDEFN